MWKILSAQRASSLEIIKTKKKSKKCSSKNIHLKKINIFCMIGTNFILHTFQMFLSFFDFFITPNLVNDWKVSSHPPPPSPPRKMFNPQNRMFWNVCKANFYLFENKVPTKKKIFFSSKNVNIFYYLLRIF